VQVAKGAVGAVVAAVLAALDEPLRDEVGDEQDGAAGAAVLDRGHDRRPQIVLGRQVRDRVVDEDGVEGPPQSDRAHVALGVLALRVQPPADGQHRRGEVDQRHPQVPLQVRGVVAAAAAELEDLLERAVDGLAHQPQVGRGLRGVLLGGREQRPPVGELVVKGRRLGHAPELRGGLGLDGAAALLAEHPQRVLARRV
jgi:hypothetical protein